MIATRKNNVIEKIRTVIWLYGLHSFLDSLNRVGVPKPFTTVKCVELATLSVSYSLWFFGIWRFLLSKLRLIFWKFSIKFCRWSVIGITVFSFNCLSYLTSGFCLYVMSLLYLKFGLSGCAAFCCWAFRKFSKFATVSLKEEELCKIKFCLVNGQWAVIFCTHIITSWRALRRMRSSFAFW